MIWFKDAAMEEREDGVFKVTVWYFGRTEDDLQDDRRVTYTFKRNIKGKGVPPFLKDYIMGVPGFYDTIEGDRMFLSKKFWTANVLYSDPSPI